HRWYPSTYEIPNTYPPGSSRLETAASISNTLHIPPKARHLARRCSNRLRSNHLLRTIVTTPPLPLDTYCTSCLVKTIGRTKKLGLWQAWFHVHAVLCTPLSPASSSSVQ
ncbi:unnamed protein product, partial [Ectocarpus sp. 8 AP-2014]